MICRSPFAILLSCALSPPTSVSFERSGQHLWCFFLRELPSGSWSYFSHKVRRLVLRVSNPSLYPEVGGHYPVDIDHRNMKAQLLDLKVIQLGRSTHTKSSLQDQAKVLPCRIFAKIPPLLAFFSFPAP